MWLTTSTGRVSKVLRGLEARWLVVSQAACIRELRRPARRWTTSAVGGPEASMLGATKDGKRWAGSRAQLVRRRADIKTKPKGQGSKTYIAVWRYKNLIPWAKRREK
jgi:hypothetical protein